ncbi:hypothetical protein HPP92_005539 [Vanilla planifolia]|uniref:Proteasome inhibitor PI31 subunit n=1 Tax=Vanilla planifolia TaxID=51239 RepID=A0A835VEZ2_VANPL|nr:hypothetical protein HPP92_005893 [Vanilla planifolia]KAG0494545.1 hypothetical protein HPP92_005539 [Vanilla planifolia]
MASESSLMAVIRASRPSFRNAHDKIAFAVHSSFLAAGFSLTAVGQRALSENPPTKGEEVGTEGWNELDDAYGFVYYKSDSGTEKAVLVKCLPVEDYLMVDVAELKDGHKEPFHLQINVKDYLTDDVGQKTNYGEMYKNLEALLKSLNTNVLQKIEPKEETSGPASGSRSARIERPGREPTVDFPEHNQQIPSGLVYPPVGPFGNDDLYPGPGAGFYPERGSGMGGGMLIGPNDPRFFGPGVRPGNIGGIPGVPPGARFDPYGPPDVPGFEPSRFVRQPRRPGADTHPDLEHFRGPDYI